MKEYTRRAFDGVASLLKERGYDTYFYTTHDPHFDNAQGFLTLNHFEHFTSEYDFPYGERKSSMGIPDHVLFDRLIETMNSRSANTPALSVLMTASDHGPWKIPSNIPFKPNGADEKENATLYADWAIGHLMERAKKCAWYQNTVFIFVGDHGLSMGHTYEMPLSYNHVPLVIHQPGIFRADTVSAPAYQPDIPATIMGIAGGKYVNNTFGIDILKERHPFVVFSADDKTGCVNDMGFYFYRTMANGESYLRKYAQLDPVNYNTGMKGLADSMERHMTDIYETARYLVERDYRGR
jgi:phosphoglycerol transferase MdoB-like AlkP superfamily enzyme